MARRARDDLRTEVLDVAGLVCLLLGAMLVELTERYCVVLQTIKASATTSVEVNTRS